MPPSSAGYIYDTGDARAMDKDVHRALHAIIVQARRGAGVGGWRVEGCACMSVCQCVGCGWGRVGCWESRRAGPHSAVAHV